MATGTTRTGNLADSLPTVIQSARSFEEYEFIVPKTVDRTDLPRGQGNTWNEIRLEQIVAMGITENTVNENPQQFQDTIFSVTPTMVQVFTRITDKTMRRISGNVAALLGQGAQIAMNRKLDQDGISQFANFSTTLAGTTVTLNHGHISASVSNIQGNVTESGMGAGPINAVLHPFGIKDLQDEIESGIGTYTVPEGLTADFYKSGFSGTVAGANVWADGNIQIDGTPDARGACYAQRAIVLVRELELKTETRRRPDVGGGADELFITSSYAYGERRDVWGRSLLHNATAPTS
ncbi:hypothetical protein LCGC14_1351830 [marine sediment metagenome]|uniref:N4-gp56 family major capsid protein n=1 Tax=marine sediment metagenome TaxID=412755 RepID=A0A0F9MRC6_9ZZZZ